MENKVEKLMNNILGEEKNAVVDLMNQQFRERGMSILSALFTDDEDDDYDDDGDDDCGDYDTHNQRMIKCPHCNYEIYEKDLLKIKDDNYGCYNCTERCTECYDLFFKEDLETDEDLWVSLCQKCLNEANTIVSCNHCGKQRKRKYCYFHDEKPYCLSCDLDIKRKNNEK